MPPDRLRVRPCMWLHARTRRMHRRLCPHRCRRRVRARRSDRRRAPDGCLMMRCRLRLCLRGGLIGIGRRGVRGRGRCGRGGSRVGPRECAAPQRCTEKPHEDQPPPPPRSAGHRRGPPRGPLNRRSNDFGVVVTAPPPRYRPRRYSCRTGISTVSLPARARDLGQARVPAITDSIAGRYVSIARPFARTDRLSATASGSGSSCKTVLHRTSPSSKSSSKVAADRP
jgi:hypothetical protein